MEKRKRVLVVDDRQQSRDGLKALLATWREFQVVGEATCGRDAVRLTEQLSPDVVLMDIRMSAMDGIEATKIIKSRMPTVRIVAITLYEEYRDEVLACGADAFLVKGCPPEEIARAITGEGLPVLEQDL